MEGWLDRIRKKDKDGRIMKKDKVGWIRLDKDGWIKRRLDGAVAPPPIVKKEGFVESKGAVAPPPLRIRRKQRIRIGGMEGWMDRFSRRMDKIRLDGWIRKKDNVRIGQGKGEGEKESVRP